MLKIIAGVALAAFAAFASPAAAQDLAQPAGHAGGALCGRRAGRHDRAHHRGAAERNSRPADGDRERRRRRRPDRHGPRRQGRARRLHRSAVGQRGAVAEPDLPQAIALRSDRRLRPCRAVLGFGARPDRAQGFSAERLQGVPDLREGRTRPRCNTARPARARAGTPARSCSTARSAPRSPTCPTAAPAPPCRTCSAAASTTCSSRFRPRRRRSRPAP